MWLGRRRWLAGAAALAAVLLLAGAVGRWYEQGAEAADARRFPPPGRFVVVGARRVHVVCIGDGSPAVLFEPSGFGNALSFSVAREALARRTRVCSYDRAGSGWSDPAGPPWLDSNIAWMQPVMRASHQAMASRSAAGTWRIVPGSGHLIASSHPQAVVDAVEGLLLLNPR